MDVDICNGGVGRLPGSSGLVANGSFVTTLPDAPRVYIPVVHFEELQRPSISPSQAYSFLNFVAWDEFFASGSTSEWKWESRRKAQNVLPFLFLGPVWICRDLDFLELNNITLIVYIKHASAKSKIKVPQLAFAESGGFMCHVVTTQSSQDLLSKLDAISLLINNHLETRRGKVLLCCESGNASSAAAAVAYCMNTLGLACEQAVQLVTAKRFSAVFDGDLAKMLLCYADLLGARKDVAAAAHQAAAAGAPHAPATAKKRRRDDADDVDMAEADDGRAFAPFSNG